MSPRTLRPWLSVPLLLSALSTTATSQVASHQKISQTAGDFGGVLGNSDFFGADVVCLGDLDGDGIAELGVGAPGSRDAGLRSGSAWVLFLRRDGTVRRQQKISGLRGGFQGVLQTGDSFGIKVEALGDLDEDGVPDMAVGAPGDDDGGRDQGAAWLLFLNPDGTVKAHQKISATEGGFTGSLDENDSLGFGIGTVGDLDGDGVTELAVGAPNDDDAIEDGGAIYLLYLRRDGTVRAQRKITEGQSGFTGPLTINNVFGDEIDSLGDLNGDGVPDLAVGTRFDQRGGRVWILFLNADGTVLSHTTIGENEGGFEDTLQLLDELGYGVERAPDLDGDGVPELLAGMPNDDDLGFNRGSFYVFFMKPDGTLKGHLKVSGLFGGFDGALRHFDRFGASTVPIGDLDGNGVVDFVAGTIADDDGGPDRGAVWVLFMDCLDTQSRRAVRNGSGVNPVCLASVKKPLIGTEWRARVTTPSPGMATLLVVRTRPRAGFRSIFGEVLIGGAPLASSLAFSDDTPALHLLAIPPEPALAGMDVYTQALVLGGGLQLCNAIDLRIGCF